MIAATVIAAAAGYGLALLLFLLRRKRVGRRAQPDENWQGISITVGALQKPRWLPRAIHGVAIDGLPFSGVQLELVNQIFSYLYRHPNAFVGNGHEGTLVEHTLHVLQTMPEDNDPLCAIVAAAHDAGKVLAWERNKGKWKMVGFHDDLSAMIESQLPAFSKLDPLEREIVYVCLKYGHKWSERPIETRTEVNARIEHIRRVVSGADHKATAAEKKQLLSRAEIDDKIFSALTTTLLEIPFQSFGLRRGIQTAGWRVERRLYLIESVVREHMIGNMDEQLRAAWDSNKREAGKITEFTKDFLRVMDERGWLVKSVPGMTGEHTGLWSIISRSDKAGDEGRRFDGIVILDAPEDYQGGLPKPTQYLIAVDRAIGGKGEAIAATGLAQAEIGIKTGTPHEEKTTEEKAAAPIIAAMAGYGFGAVARARKEAKKQRDEAAQTQAQAQAEAAAQAKAAESKNSAQKPKQGSVTRRSRKQQGVALD